MEKSKPLTTGTDIPQIRGEPYVWRPGIRRIPWSAFLALLVVFLSAPTSAAVLVISNGHIADWKVQPSVLLSIISGIKSSALLYALWKGVAISWWRAALHGTTLEHLNRLWFSGTSTSSAVFSIRHARKLGIASIFTTVAAIAVSPLLQKASHPRLLNVAQEVDMEIYLPTKLPSGFAGVAWNSHPPLPGNTLLTPDFLLAIHASYTQIPFPTLKAPGFFCEGTCEAIVHGAGISKDTL